MDRCIEVLFTCDNNENQHTCTAWDYRTGTNLMSYKGGSAAQSHSLNIYRNDYVLLANSVKPLLHVWPLNSQEQITDVRFILPGKANAVAISPDGYLIAAVQETLYIWDSYSGRMLNTISKHYQAINCIHFTDDGSHFASASKDGSIIVWNLTRVVAPYSDNQESTYTFNDHGLPVTDVHIGIGGMRAYLISVSLDRTCKFYDLSNGKLLLNVVFGEGLQCIKTNKMETCVFVGTVEGNIYEFHTEALPRRQEYHVEKESSNKFEGHKTGESVTCLALSLDGVTLISGSNDKQVCVWDIASRQLLKTLQFKGAITNLSLSFVSVKRFQPEQKPTKVFLANLKRMIDPADEDEYGCVDVIVTEEMGQEIEDRLLKDFKIEDDLELVMPIKKASNDNTKELEKLRAEVQHLKDVNKKLFEFSTNQLLQNQKK